jgi:hypothetical protein
MVFIPFLPSLLFNYPIWEKSTMHGYVSRPKLFKKYLLVSSKIFNGKLKTKPYPFVDQLS